MAKKPTKTNFPDDDEILMSVSEVAKLDSTSPKTIRGRIKSGALPAYFMDGQWRISPRDHRNYRRDRRTG